MNTICTALFRPDSLRSLYVHFENVFVLLLYLKRYCSHSYNPISDKFYAKYELQHVQAILFLSICQIYKIYGTLMISHLSYIDIIHKAMFNLVASAKRLSRLLRLPSGVQATGPRV